MSIRDAETGRLFECPPNINDDVQAICGGGEYDVPIAFVTPPRVLDIGANVGAFAYWATRRWPGADIDCYEPNPEALAFLRPNVERFAPGAKVHAVGVRAIAGTSRLLRGVVNGHTNLCSASFRDIGSQSAEGALDVDVVDAAELPDANVVKVDTEGLELEILGRYLDSRAKIPSLILVETHTRTDRVLLESLLEGVGLELSLGRVRSPNVGTFAFVDRNALAPHVRAR